MTISREGKESIVVAAIIVIMLVLDQCLKLFVATNFALGESFPLTSWFEVCYVENDGMAFGIEWFSKFVLTSFRIIAVGVLCWYIWRLIHINKARVSYLIMVSLVTAGALGNIIDCVFYGKLFGYADWFYGKVVDMLYFPLIRNAAGECIFFRPVFNLADSCITVAVIAILLFFRKDLDDSLQKVESPKSKVESN